MNEPLAATRVAWDGGDPVVESVTVTWSPYLKSSVQVTPTESRQLVRAADAPRAKTNDCVFTLLDRYLPQALTGHSNGWTRARPLPTSGAMTPSVARRNMTVAVYPS